MRSSTAWTAALCTLLIACEGGEWPRFGVNVQRLDTTLDTGDPGPGPTPSICDPAFYVNAPPANLPLTPDPLSDFTDSILANPPSATGAEIDIAGYHSGVATCDAGQVTTLMATFPCSQTCGAGFVLCHESGGTDLAEGAVRVVVLELAGNIPLDSSDTSYVYGVGQDIDGDTSNNWEAQSPFDGDLLQNTDRWHQAVYDHGAGSWRLKSWQVGANQSTTELTDATRAIFVGNRLFFLMQGTGDNTATPYRGTALKHDGEFSASARGADVTGENGTSPLIVPST